MARGKAINVKIATPKVIKALETKLAEIKKAYAEQGANEAKYQKAREKWQKEIGKWAIEHFSKAENIRTNYRQWNKTLNVDFDLIVNETDFPTEPEDAVTGAVEVANAGTTTAFVAETVTAVPVSTVSTNSTTSSESTELSVGTGIVIGLVADVPAVCAVHVGDATVPVFFFTEVTTIGAASAS